MSRLSLLKKDTTGIEAMMVQFALYLMAIVNRGVQ